jgi:hypothetical protein
MYYNAIMTKYLLIALIFVTSFAHAQSTVLIQKPMAKVYANPSLTSEVLVELKKGSKVEVAGLTEKGDWAKIKVTVSGFQFDGWVQRSTITKPKASAAPAVAAKKVVKPQARVTPKPASTMTKSSSTELEQFFEPSAPSSGSSSFTPAPTPDPVARVDEKPKKAARVREPRTAGDNWKSGKLVLYGTPGYAIHQYVFSDSTQDAFRYNLTGISAMVGAEYNIVNFFDDLMRINTQLQVQYVMFNTKTNLLDGTNTQFSDLTAKNWMLDGNFRLKFMFNFDKIVSKPFLIGLTGGYEYMIFSGDDIIDDNGTPVGLYVNQTTTSIPVGVVAELHFLDPVVLTLGTDVLIKSTAKESPASTSGSNPKPEMGFAPYFNLNFPIVGETHFMGIRYQLRVQDTKFTGLSTSRVNNELNDATSSHVFHTLGLEYAYHF